MVEEFNKNKNKIVHFEQCYYHGSDGGCVGGSACSVPLLRCGGGGDMAQALCLPEEAVVAVQVRRPLGQQVVVGVADLTAVAHDGEDAGALVAAAAAAAQLLPLGLMG